MEHFFWTSEHIRLFKSTRRKNSVEKPKTFSEAKEMKIYAVLLHFSNCCDLCVKSVPQLPKIDFFIKEPPLERECHLNEKPSLNSVLKNRSHSFKLHKINAHITVINISV